MGELCRQYPDDPMLGSIQRQLQYVAEWTHNGKKPSDEQVKRLSFGVMASRAVDEIDQGLAQQLYRLANYLDEWR